MVLLKRKFADDAAEASGGSADEEECCSDVDEDGNVAGIIDDRSEESDECPKFYANIKRRARVSRMDEVQRLESAVAEVADLDVEFPETKKKDNPNAARNRAIDQKKRRREARREVRREPTPEVVPKVAPEVAPKVAPEVAPKVAPAPVARYVSQVKLVPLQTTIAPPKAFRVFLPGYHEQRRPRPTSQAADKPPKPPKPLTMEQLRAPRQAKFDFSVPKGFE